MPRTSVFMMLSHVFSLALLASTVSAHGYVREWIMNGVTYVTLLPAGAPNWTAPVQGIGMTKSSFKVRIFEILRSRHYYKHKLTSCAK